MADKHGVPLSVNELKAGEKTQKNFAGDTGRRVERMGRERQAGNRREIVDPGVSWQLDQVGNLSRWI
jgi:hypothetical protein